MLDIMAADFGENEIEQQMDELIAAIHTSDYYREVQSTLEELKKDPELYTLVNEYRTRRFYEKTSTRENWDDTLTQLRQRCMTNPVAARFLKAELDYCRLLRRISRQFFDEMRLDLEFLEE